MNFVYGFVYLVQVPQGETFCLCTGSRSEIWWGL